MNEYSLAAKILENLGITGLIIFVVWKLVDRWAGKFLDIQDRQAQAMGQMAAAVREGQGEQRELLLAVRVLASKVDETKQWMKELSEHILPRKEAA